MNNEIIRSLVEAARTFRFCGPSDDPDEQTAVTAGYRHLVIQFKRLVSPILPPPAASRLNSIDVEIDNLYSAYDAHAELDALLPEIETALDACEMKQRANVTMKKTPDDPMNSPSQAYYSQRTRQRASKPDPTLGHAFMQAFWRFWIGSAQLIVFATHLERRYATDIPRT